MKKFLVLVFIFVLVGCGGMQPETGTQPEKDQPLPTSAGPVTIRLMTHDSFSITEDVLKQFIDETGIKVEIFKGGDGGSIVNQAILSKDDPLADVAFGIDSTFFSRAIEGDIFIPYESPELANLDDSLKLDPENRLIPVDFGDVCLNYDKGWFANSELDPPSSLDDLVDPAYANLTVVENPATSTPGLSFLFTTISVYGEDGHLDYWKKLVDNGVVITDGWKDAYWGYFSAASDGDRPIVVSYASSPPAEVFYAENPPEEAPTAAVVSDDTCFRQIEFVGILKGAKHEAEAQKLVDFMLSTKFQEDIPLQMFVYPANQKAQLPDVFVKHSLTPDNPVTLKPEVITANRENWITNWTETVLR